MANKNLFNNSQKAPSSPKTNVVNEAGGTAYKLDSEHALAQLASTGCLNATFYQTAETQLDEIVKLANEADPKYLAQVAVFARKRGLMKDMPALLAAVLAKRDVQLLKQIFPSIIDSGKMLRNFVQMIRSGKFGRHSLGTAPKKLVANWLNSRNDYGLLKASIGNDPSLVDCIKLSHPKAPTAERQAFYNYLLDKEYDEYKLPDLVRQYEAYKAKKTGTVPNVPFEMLTALPLGKKEWTEIAKGMPWHATRMNLNTLARHGVFEDPAMVKMVASRLRDPELVRKEKVFPYQLLAAYLFATSAPHEIREALQDAMELSLENIPEIDGQIYVFPDISGSMSAPVTGSRGSATTQIHCRDLAALVSAALVRKNRSAHVIPFSDEIADFDFNARDSVMTNAEKLRNLPSGGTNCSAPMRELVRRKAEVDLIVYVSDNMSWADSSSGQVGGYATATMEAYAEVKKRNPKVKMVMLDGCPNQSTQGKERADIMNLGGFSDVCFEMIADFAAGRMNKDHWVGEIKKIDLDEVKRAASIAENRRRE